MLLRTSPHNRAAQRGMTSAPLRALSITPSLTREGATGKSSFHDSARGSLAPEGGAAATQSPAATVRNVTSSARTAAAMVAPVVMTSSTKSACAGGPSVRITRIAPAWRQRCRALAPRCSPRPIVRTGRTLDKTPAEARPATAACASNPGRSIPLARVDAARAGTGTTATGPLAPWPPTPSAGAIVAAARSTASAKRRSRSLLPPSFQATTIAWLGPVNSAMAHTGSGAMPSIWSRGAEDSDRNGVSHQAASQSSHHRTSCAPHPGQFTGTTRRAMSRAARAAVRNAPFRDSPVVSAIHATLPRM